MGWSLAFRRGSRIELLWLLFRVLHIGDPVHDLLLRRADRPAGHRWSHELDLALGGLLGWYVPHEVLRPLHLNYSKHAHLPGTDE
jgi:hypothetical protein